MPKSRKQTSDEAKRQRQQRIAIYEMLNDDLTSLYKYILKNKSHFTANLMTIPYAIFKKIVQIQLPRTETCCCSIGIPDRVSVKFGKHVIKELPPSALFLDDDRVEVHIYLKRPKFTYHSKYQGRIYDGQMRFDPVPDPVAPHQLSKLVCIDQNGNQSPFQDVAANFLTYLFSYRYYLRHAIVNYKDQNKQRQNQVDDYRANKLKIHNGKYSFKNIFHDNLKDFLNPQL